MRETPTPHAVRRLNHKCRSIPPGRTLLVECLASALVHWSVDGWGTVSDVHTRDTGLGVHVADLPTSGLPEGTEVLFTVYWPEAGHWEGVDFCVRERTS